LHYDFVTNRHKLFNPLFYKLKNSKTRIVTNYGGAGSGKSVAQHQLELLLQLSSDCDYDTLFVRKYATDIYDSCYTLLQNLAKKYGIYDEFDWVFSNSKRQITNKTTGQRILFKGLDDTEKIKSIAGIKRIVFEEASQGEFEDFLELNRRARGMEGIQIFLLFNPINVNHWIKTKIIDGEAFQDDLTVLHTTYKDNKFLTDQDRKQLELLETIDYNHYRIYCLGEWGIDDPEKLFAKDYDSAKHYGKSFRELYNSNLEVYLSYDFNITNTCLAIQINGEAINVLKEYHIKGYDLFMLCELLKKEFSGHRFIINGDASGKGGSALSRGNESGYEIIKSCMGVTWDSFFVPGVNPSHLNSRLLTNIIFKMYQINISNECVELHNDLISVEIDNNGSIDPYKKKHPERSHWLDPLRYHLNAHHSSKLKDLGLKGLE
jgi:phage terminase large subunit